MVSRRRCPLLALKRPAVAPAERLLTEAVLKLACVVRTAARDRKPTLREDPGQHPGSACARPTRRADHPSYGRAMRRVTVGCDKPR
jgi:hypothetical protein